MGKNIMNPEQDKFDARMKLVADLVIAGIILVVVLMGIIIGIGLVFGNLTIGVIQ